MTTIRSSLRAAIAAVLIGAALAALPLAASAQQTSQLFKGFSATSNDPVKVDANSLEVAEQGAQRVSTFEGNVIVTRGDTTVTADKMVIYSPSQGATDEKPFTRIEATGHVRVTSGSQTLTGAAAIFDVAGSRITMTGGVVLTQGANMIRGAKLTVDTANGKARIEQAPGQRIHGVFGTAKP